MQDRRFGFWKAVALVSVVGMVAFVIVAYIVFEPGKNDSELLSTAREVCFGGFPTEDSAGITTGIDSNGAFAIDVGGSRDKLGTEDTEAHIAAIKCAEGVFRRVLDIEAGAEEEKGLFASQRPLPLGMIAQQWQPTDFFLDLTRPSTDKLEEIIFNLRFPAYVGEQRAALSEWCSAFSACVDCSPIGAQSVADADGATISLKDNPSVEKIKMWGDWVNPQKPWELVDESGTRYFYICQGE